MNNLYKIIDKKKIKKKYKIFPKNIPDFLSLVGDKSDNIPGVHSIGEKTAQILIQKYGNLKNIYKNINKIHKLKIRNIKNILINLKLTKKKIFFFLRLIKLNLNFKIDKKFKNLKLKKPNNKKLKEFFKKNQFKILKNYKNFY
ncbi:5'-3' exonuclease H3TH domain-containing protein [Buchnera aphidicola (Ceratoglyphina bambusae)]